MADKRIILLVSDGSSSRIIFHHLCRKFPIHSVILEKKESNWIFIKRRIKRLGFWKVAGQIAFQLFVVKWLNITSAKRIKKIIADNNLNIDPIPAKNIVKVNSINEQGVLELLLKIQPDLVVVNGTRIISKRILSAVQCPFINTHTGITPMYRGVHGGYWALVNNDTDHCGVTIHLVDAGIDTGGSLYQVKISPTKDDTFVTYPILQIAQALHVLTMAVRDGLQGSLKVCSSEGQSHLWYHPTIGQYFYNRIFRKIK